MSVEPTLLANLLKILPYADEGDAAASGMGMAEIRERLAPLMRPVPNARQIRRTLLKVESVGSRGTTRATVWFRTIHRTDFTIQNMNVNMAMAMCALQRVASRHLPAVVMDDLADTFADAERFLAKHRGQPGVTHAHTWQRKTLRIEGTQPAVLPQVEPSVYRQVSEALFFDRKLSFRNTPFGEKQPNPRLYIMSPLGMVDRAGVLYMVAWGAKKPGHRFLFRMDRMSDVRVLEEAADADPSFDLENYVHREDALNFSPGPDTGISLFAHEPVVADGSRRRHPLREFRLSPDQRVEERDGGFVLHATVRPSTMLFQLLHGYASSIEILSPASLRARFEYETNALVEIYLSERA